MGEGYSYGTSNAACGPAPSPFVALPFGPAAGDTQVPGFFTNLGARNMNDGSFGIDLAAEGFGTFRFFSKPYTQLFINTNGHIFFERREGTFAPPFPASETGTGRNAFIAAFGVDLDLRTAGQVFYGVRNVIGDAQPELIITYYRVPLISGGGYATFQVVLGQPQQVTAGTPVERNGTIGVQYYGGIDSVDGQPFTRNVPASSGRIGLTGDQGFMSTSYRNAGVGGPAFGGGNLTVFFGPRGEQLLTGGPGYRMLTHNPGAGTNVADLAEQNLVQGVTDEYVNAQDNVFTEFNFGTGVSGFTAPAARTTALTAGKGMLWYFFDSTFNPVRTATTGVGAGTSESFAVPTPLLAAGTPQTADVSTVIDATADGTGARYELLGNPFEANLDVTNIAAFATGGTFASNVAQFYDPAINNYQLSTANGNRVALWQGFFLDVGTATGITYPLTARTPVATPFYGLGADAPVERLADVEDYIVAFELAGTTPEGVAVGDRAAALYFREGAGDGWDTFDAGKLAPFAPYAAIAFAGERDGSAALKAQESRALDAASFDVPLVVDAVGTSPELTLRWNQLESVPAAWGLTLHDLVTGTEVDLRTATEYTFSVTPSAVTGPANSVMTPPEARTLVADASALTSADRFVLHVETARTTATEEGAITEFALAAPAPNPTAGTAMVSFDVPEASAVSVAVYDLLGRRVAVLAQGEMAAGRHTSRLEAGALAPGVYVVWMQAGSFTATHRVTVVR